MKRLGLVHYFGRKLTCGLNGFRLGPFEGIILIDY